MRKGIIGKVVLIVLAALILLVFLFKTATPSLFRSLQRKLYFTPLESSSAPSFLTGFTNWFFNQEECQLEKVRLEQENLKLTKENASLKYLALENQILKENLNFVKNKSSQYLTSQIIGREKAEGFDWYILDSGEKDGIKEGYPVVVGDGFLVGKIVKIRDHFSYFLPILDRHLGLAATIISGIEKAGESKISTIVETNGVVKGKYGIFMEMELIPLEKEVKKGDFVFTSGLEKDVPAGLIIGQVEKVETMPGAFFQKAIIVPLIDFNQLKILTVLTP